ncbi:DUF6531 domain-containing protein [Pseudomonas tohonis]|uniref:DUF6531 domain-containing protein n=1 Tax=Pseudomonas tohonis TaxID=2725477 RepID=UPI0021DA4A79|nr:DUF6531 domain-containing protein [Pseudomonas tohonis]UXY55135.1 DUF6531 domain-containing protein [Pseudomonas tohonis]
MQTRFPFKAGAMLALLLLASTARAEYFYWWAPVYGFDKFPSRDAAAQAVLSVYTENDRDWYSNYSITSIDYVREGTYIVEMLGYFVGTTPSRANNLVYLGGDSCPPGASYDTLSYKCSSTLLDANKGLPPTDLTCAVPNDRQGNPINISIGNKVQTIVDAPAASNSLIGLTRTYNSADGVWRHSYSTHLEKNGSSLILVRADGRETKFQLQDGVNSYGIAASGILTRQGEKWAFEEPNGTKLAFNSALRLSKITERNGQWQALTYFDALITITDSFGNTATLRQDAEYQPKLFAMGETSVSYTYNSIRRLTAVTTTRGAAVSSQTYQYEDANPNLLTGITDERGIRYATWAYDDQGRAISSEHAGGAERTLVSYNADGSSTVTNALGKRTTYRFQTIQGVRRITAIEGEPSANCPNSNSTFTYDDRGLVKTRTDNKGNITTFDYNERGLETSRTEAFGTPQARTVTTTWHPTLFLPASVTEPDRITTYRYDDQGRPLSQVVAPH